MPDGADPPIRRGGWPWGRRNLMLLFFLGALVVTVVIAVVLVVTLVDHSRPTTPAPATSTLVFAIPIYNDTANPARRDAILADDSCFMCMEMLSTANWSLSNMAGMNTVKFLTFNDQKTEWSPVMNNADAMKWLNTGDGMAKCMMGLGNTKVNETRGVVFKFAYVDDNVNYHDDYYDDDDDYYYYYYYYYDYYDDQSSPTTVTTSTGPTTSPGPCQVFFYLDVSTSVDFGVPIEIGHVERVSPLVAGISNFAAASYGGDTSGPLNLTFGDQDSLKTQLDKIFPFNPLNGTVANALDEMKAYQMGNIVTVLYTNSSQNIINAIGANPFSDRTIGIGLNGQNMSDIAAYSFSPDGADENKVAETIQYICNTTTTVPTSPTTSNTGSTVTSTPSTATTTVPGPPCQVFFYLDLSNFAHAQLIPEIGKVRELADNIPGSTFAAAAYGSAGQAPLTLKFGDRTNLNSELDIIYALPPMDADVSSAIGAMNNYDLTNIVTVLYSGSPASQINAAGPNSYLGQTVGVGICGQDLTPLAIYSFPFDSDQLQIFFYLDVSTVGKPQFVVELGHVNRIADETARDGFVPIFAGAGYGYDGQEPLNLTFGNRDLLTQEISPLYGKTPLDVTVASGINALNNYELGSIVIVLYTNSEQGAIDASPQNNYKTQTIGIGLAGQNLGTIAAYSFGADASYDDQINAAITSMNYAVVAECNEHVCEQHIADFYKYDYDDDYHYHNDHNDDHYYHHDDYHCHYNDDHSATTVPTTTPAACQIFFYLDVSTSGKPQFVAELGHVNRIADETVNDGFVPAYAGAGYGYIGQEPLNLTFGNRDLLTDELRLLYGTAAADANVSSGINALNNYPLGNIVTVLYTNSDQASIDASPSNNFKSQTIGIGLSGQDLTPLAAYSFGAGSDQDDAINAALTALCTGNTLPTVTTVSTLPTSQVPARIFRHLHHHHRRHITKLCTHDPKHSNIWALLFLEHSRIYKLRVHDYDDYYDCYNSFAHFFCGTEHNCFHTIESINNLDRLC
ncbi:unnamed protein product, partial [Mesorhabditis spiculigera]